MGDTPSNPLPTPPLAALGQNAYMTAQVAHTTNSSINRRRCCHQGYCDKWADECGGYKKGLCSQVQQGHVILPSKEEQITMRKSMDTERAREKKKRQRQEEKDANKKCKES